MQYVSPFFSVFAIVALALPAAADATPERVAQQLHEALSRELAVLMSVQDAASAAAAVPQLQAVFTELAAMERSYESEKALWTYIDNTEGVKLPLVELLQRVAIEFTRLERAAFFHQNDLHQLLAPQLHAPKKDENPAKAAS